MFNLLLSFNPSKTDLYFCYGIVGIIVIFYMFSGIVILLDKNTKMISNNNSFANQKLFTLLYGLDNIICSSILIVISILGLIYIDSSLPFLFTDLGVFVFLWITQFILQKIFKI